MENAWNHAHKKLFDSKRSCSSREGKEAFGVFLCRLNEVSLDVTPKQRPVPVPVIPETAAAALAGVSHHLKKKKIKRGSLRLRERSGPQPLITPLPRQHSSRQQLQQINLSLTVHLDWINLELEAITAIGSRGYSPNASCYPALGIKKRSHFLPHLSFLRQIDWIRCFSGHWILSLTKSSLFSINRFCWLFSCRRFRSLETKKEWNRCLMRVTAPSTLKLLPGAN